MPLLPPIVVRVDDSGLSELDRRTDALDAKVRDVFDNAMERVAARARASHVFHNRSGVLEGSIEPLDVTGSFSEGTLEAGVEAGAPYADAVAKATQDDFLGRALDAEMPGLEADLEALLEAEFSGV